MNIRPCDLTNEQWAALRRESEQKAAPAKSEPEPEPVNTNVSGCWRNGRFIPFTDAPSDTSKWEQMGDAAQPAGARLTHELARHVCQRTGGTVVLDGSIAQIDSQYQLILNAFNCSTRALLASAQAVASDKNNVLGALGGAASGIRTKLGESLASIQKFNMPLEAVTTPSLEALQAYTIGWRAYGSGEESVAVGSFERAISLDPNFAMAYAALGRDYGGLGEGGLAATNIQKAYELRDRVSEREKFYISSHYETDVTGNSDQAIQVFKLWTQVYPWDVEPIGDLGWAYADLGQYDESLAAARRALELAPDRELPYELLAYSYLELDRLDEGVATSRTGLLTCVPQRRHHGNGASVGLGDRQAGY